MSQDGSFNGLTLESPATNAPPLRGSRAISGGGPAGRLLVALSFPMVAIGHAAPCVTSAQAKPDRAGNLDTPVQSSSKRGNLRLNSISLENVDTTFVRIKMSITPQIILATLGTLLLAACSDKKTSVAPVRNDLPGVVKTFGYEVIDTDNDRSYVELEELDRSFYEPLSYESARIRSLKTLDAYGGPELGNYYLTIEDYRTPEEAEKRAEEYRDFGRLAGTTIYDKNVISKRTVRCWGYASAERVYLLTTHAAMFSAMEEKSHSVIDGVKAYEQKRAQSGPRE